MGKYKLFSFLFLLLAACSQAQPALADVKTFEECVKEGNAVRKSLPAQCVSKQGKIFIDPTPLVPPQIMPNQGKLCVDNCGDGTCAEMVCMAEGCPCPENKDSCPKDCGS